MLSVRLYGLAALVCLAPARAHAGTPDQIARSTPRPEGSDTILLTYAHGGEGFLYSQDRGETFSALCMSALGELHADGGFEPISGLQEMIVTGDGHVLAAGLRGLWVDDGQFCNWRAVDALKDEWVTSLAHDPRDPNVVYGALGTGGSDDNDLFRRNEDGSVERFGARSSVRARTLRLAARPQGGLRFYQTAVVGQRTVVDADAQIPLPDGGSLPSTYVLDVYALRFSDDEGQTWTEQVIDTELGEELWLEAIDPTDVDRVIVQRMRLEGLDTLLVADASGAPPETWLEVNELSGIAFEPSGAVWIGGSGAGAGVWRAERAGGEPSKLRQDPVYCLALRDGELELCEHEDYGVADSTTLMLGAPRLATTVDRVHSCEGLDVVERCRTAFCLGRCAGNHWPESPMCAESYGAMRGRGCSSDSTVIVPDAAVSDAGTADAAVNAKPSSGGCGCGVLGERRADRAVLWTFLMLLVATLSWRKRRLSRCADALRRGARRAHVSDIHHRHKH